jgi:futalosine hydrolase
MPTLVLVPTDLERRILEDLGGIGPVESCGFGPVAAAARTAALIASTEPAAVLLIGIAGTYDTGAIGVGQAVEFDRVEIDGFQGAGFEPWPGVGSSIELRPGAGSGLLTVLSPSATSAEAAERRLRHAGAVAEDMEGYGVAVACAIARVPLAVVRGISNEAGDRDHGRWRIREALASARTLANARRS